MEQGYGFWWPPFETPKLIKPDGGEINFEVENYVPFLTERAPHAALPASKDEEEPTSKLASVQIERSVTFPDNAPSGGEMICLECVSPEGVMLQQCESSATAPAPPPDEFQRDLVAEACSIAHLMSHLPKNPHCAACQRAKMQRVQARRTRTSLPDALIFGELVTCDYLVANGAPSQGLHGETTALVLMDRATGWLEVHPEAHRTSEKTQLAFRWFQGFRDVIQTLYSDNVPEFVSSTASMGIVHDTSTPYNSPTNGIAERAIRKVLDGTRALLEHAGFGPKWWTYACRHFVTGLNATKVDGRSPFRERFRKDFQGKRIPFGALVDVRPPKIYLDQLPKFASRGVPAVFLGYHFAPGGRWRGEYFAAPLLDFERTSTRKLVRIFRIKEVVFDPADVSFPLRKARDTEVREIHDLATDKAGAEVCDGAPPPPQPSTPKPPGAVPPDTAGAPEPASGSASSGVHGPSLPPDGATDAGGGS